MSFPSRSGPPGLDSQQVEAGDNIDAGKRIHEALRQSERRLAAQKQALELAVSGAPIGVVLNPVAQEARSQVSGDARVALYVVDPDARRLRFGAAAGMSSHYTSAVDGFEIRPTNPACGKVAFTGERILVEDVMTEPLWEPYRALAQQNSIRACWSFPVRSVADKVLGTIAIYYDSPRQPQQEDIDAVELLAKTAALVIERHKAAEERAAAHERLRRSESRLRLALAGARAGAWEWDAGTDEIVWSPEVVAITGLASATRGRGLETYLAMMEEEDRDTAVCDLKAALGEGGPFTTEFRIRRINGVVIWLSISGVIEHAETGKPLRAYGILQDVTERKAGEEQIRLLMREVNHRAKNMLSVVSAIAHQTATKNPQDFIERFSERIQALSASQDLLIRNEWKGVKIEDLVRAQLAPFASFIDTRIAMRGPGLHLKPASAQAIGLALHELATNAGKYGALSTDKGRVDVFWATDGGALTMCWTEHEGPLVSAPKRRGFGTTVIERMAEASLGGTVGLDYAPSGLTWRLTCPAESALEPGERSSSARERATLLEYSMARRHVATGEQNVARQREIVARLERGGHNSLVAKSLLASFEELQNMHIAHRDRLEKALAEISKS
jgi:PAS domain S-box-containing protein